jgi:MFS transporter, DHA2 family, multidrug resistance protein
MTDSKPAVPLSSEQIRYLLVALALATGMEFYTFESINLVLPDITGSLGVSFDEASWVLTVYSSFLFLGVPLSFWLAGHFGYKRFLIWNIRGDVGRQRARAGIGPDAVISGD